MIFQPLIPFAALVILALLLIGGCVAVAVIIKGGRVRWLLRAAVAALLLFALARPGFPTTVATQQAQGSVQVYLLIDVSASVIAEDWNGDQPRLVGVKEDVKNLVEAMPGAKFSIITFASQATMRVPLTSDDAAIRSALDVLEPEVSSTSGGTAPTEASALLHDRLQRGQESYPGEEQYVYYFGDGEQTAKEASEPFAPPQKLAGGAVFGYGTPEGGKMLETFDAYQREYSDSEPEYLTDPTTGQPGLSKIDEGQLQTIAQDLGVEYFHRSAGSSLTSEYTPPEFEMKLIDQEDSTSIDDIFWIPLIGVFAWIVVEGILALRRIRELASVGKVKKSV